MAGYVFRRFLWLIPTIFLVSLIAFILIDLPPGDYLSSYVTSLQRQGEEIDLQTIEVLRERYGFDEPIYIRYAKWIGNILQGDFGRSFGWNNAPVDELIWSRLQLTLMISVSSLLLTWMIALPIGIYSAIYQYSVGDYVITFLGFIGLAVPNFLLALILMYVAFRYFDTTIIGLFSPEYTDAPWSWAKVRDLLEHVWVPVVILATGGTAGLIRIMRANLLDELGRPYVTTARAKGMREWWLILKYPVRVALNPFVSTIGFTIPQLVSGTVIVAVVLNLPTTGPLLLSALEQQDMYLAGAFILLLGLLTVFGTLISDLLLAALDPRIRYE